MKPKVVSIVGPTAVGKSKLGVEVCEVFDGEVISGDSMQIYTGMDIGTAKVTEEEKKGIPHHMIDIKDPKEGFSAAEFQERARELIADITSRGKLPVVVGGTGMYIQSLLFDYSFSQNPRDMDVVRRLEEKLENEGKNALHQYLETVDPAEAKRIHPNNTKRVIRALEIYETTGSTKTEQHNGGRESSYNFKIIGLEMNRKLLYNRIDQRVNSMVTSGLVEEVRSLLERNGPQSQAMQAIGYKEIIPYLEGGASFEEVLETLKRNSRRYAKRQYTYFKNKLPVDWYEVTEETFSEKKVKILSDLEGFLHNKEK
ncbi:tRNA (adenosine(37)-N6)-dimethylallyltransferase MiaA [Salimicrobium halophilum]|uniref:tRNA dimethylallyltransferase n=1 Tax=Salimicrobium halophilum TaxID=86666 RepID=A0A1G8Q6D6_9BACI|nr:tRNA (adenosine(37)-N6)-dimethylallyltransferase MiaA [Salimicrobium halophilum]SDJ00339.1 tRNA dimethylallyltransferase [Salimicrobium halophilum]